MIMRAIDVATHCITNENKKTVLAHTATNLCIFEYYPVVYRLKQHRFYSYSHSWHFRFEFDFSIKTCQFSPLAKNAKTIAKHATIHNSILFNRTHVSLNSMNIVQFMKSAAAAALCSFQCEINSIDLSNCQ